MANSTSRLVALPDIDYLATLADAAVAWAKAGFDVFPVSPDKRPHPLLGATGGFHHGTRGLEKIREWWTRDPEALVGVVPGSGGCVVLDVDGEDGRLQFWSVAAANGFDLTSTPIVETPGGGIHVWFDRSNRHGVAGNAAVAGIGDVRGDAGYVVVPPSSRSNGRYVFANDVPEVAPLPDWVLREKWLRFTDPSDQIDTAGITDTDVAKWVDDYSASSHDARGERRIYELVGQLAAAKPGNRHTTMTQTVGWLLEAAHRGDTRIDVRDALDMLRRVFATAVTDRDAAREFNAAATDFIEQRIAEGPPPAAVTGPADDRLQPGGVVFDVPSIPEATWGKRHEVLAAKGEPTMLYSSTGLGKTTLGQRIALAAIGIGDRNSDGLVDVLGYPVANVSRVLYVASDRPQQALRSLRRMTFNSAVQICVANHVDVLSLHHPRKAGQDGRPQLGLDDLYGSTFLKDGQGSVIALTGVAGDGIFKFRHLKHPAEEVGPFDVEVNYTTGTLKAIGYRDLLDYLRDKGAEGATTLELAAYLFEKPTPSDPEMRRIRRRLGNYERDGAIRSDKQWREKRWYLANPLILTESSRTPSRTPSKT